MALQPIKILLILDIKAKIEVSGTNAEVIECFDNSEAILAPLCSIWLLTTITSNFLYFEFIKENQKNVQGLEGYKKKNSIENYFIISEFTPILNASLFFYLHTIFFYF